jgi:phosphoribosyl 1,2-cyclic phosphodiesterase
MDLPSAEAPVPHLAVRSLASGSSGNAYLLELGADRLLIDCGVGVRQIEARLSETGESWASVTGVVITHEHRDHIRALPSLLRRRLPLLMTAGTASATGAFSSAVRILSGSEAVGIGSFTVTPVTTCHDATEPCGLLVRAGDATAAFLTDMGCVTEEVVQAARAADLAVVEANHDVEMLQTGPYPAHLKRRIAGRYGHLSNRQCGELLGDALTSGAGPTTIWLAHLSATNNRPRVALTTVEALLGRKLRDRRVAVLPRHVPGPRWIAGPRPARQLSLLAD